MARKALINGAQASNTTFLIFVPFALYRNHAVWRFKDVSRAEYQTCIQSHIRWLRQRLDLFAQITLAGLETSTLKSFELHIFVDGYSDEPWLLAWLKREIFKKIEKQNIKASIHTVDLYPMPEPYHSYPATLTPVIKNIVSNTNKPRERFAMIRLDGDDTLMPDYLSLVDEYIFVHEYNQLNTKVLGEPLIIDIPYGIQYQVNASKAWLTMWPESNFTSLIIPTNQIGESYLPFSYAHDEIPTGIQRHVLANHKPMWIQGIHSNNLCNQVFEWSIPVDGSKTIVDLLANPSEQINRPRASE